MPTRAMLVAALVLACLAATARASPPITEPWGHEPVPKAPGVMTPSPHDALAREPRDEAYGAVVTGTALGALCMIGSVRTGYGPGFATGLGLAAAGAVAGPALGWLRAGYPEKAALGTLFRLGILTGAVGEAAVTTRERSGTVSYDDLLLTGFAAVVVVTVEAFAECAMIEPHIRRHGPGGTSRSVSFGPAAAPSGAPALAVSIPLP